MLRKVSKNLRKNVGHSRNFSNCPVQNTEGRLKHRTLQLHFCTLRTMWEAASLSTSTALFSALTLKSFVWRLDTTSSFIHVCRYVAIVVCASVFCRSHNLVIDSGDRVAEILLSKVSAYSRRQR